MNAKSMLPTPAIKAWVSDASNQLAAVEIPSNRLDAELILSYGLNVDRTYLHAHPEQIISTSELDTVNKYLAQRLKRVPVAYIIGQKDFYGRSFIVNSDTLIPRPESEDIIEILKEVISSNSNNQPLITNLIDVGTGSGCLGITAKLEFPNLDVTLIDISQAALTIAQENAQKMSADVNLLKNNLLNEYSQKIDIIIANLPYVDKAWDRSPETDYEPATALFADDNGLELIKLLMNQASTLLSDNGYIIIEADPEQHKNIINFAKDKSFDLFKKANYILAFSKNR